MLLSAFLFFGTGDLIYILVKSLGIYDMNQIQNLHTIWWFCTSFSYLHTHKQLGQLRLYIHDVKKLLKTMFWNLLVCLSSSVYRFLPCLESTFSFFFVTIIQFNQKPNVETSIPTYVFYFRNLQYIHLKKKKKLQWMCELGWSRNMNFVCRCQLQLWFTLPLILASSGNEEVLIDARSRADFVNNTWEYSDLLHWSQTTWNTQIAARQVRWWNQVHYKICMGCGGGHQDEDSGHA